MEGQPPLSSDMARRILLFDEDGQPIDPGIGGTMMDGFQMYGITAKNFSRIARAVVQTTPYIWAEFRDVPLRPDFEKEEAARLAAHAASLESGVHGTATGVAPGFTKTLADGTIISVTSVTKAILDNQNWVMTGQPSWRADGEVLAQRSNPEWFKNPYSPKFPDPLEFIQVEFSNLKKDAQTVARCTSKFDPKTHKPIFDDWAFETIAVPPGQKFGAALAGVASGPWDTASSHDIDMQELPAIDPAKSPRGTNTNRTGFEVVVGKDCYIRDLATDAKVTLASEPPSQFAVRVMVKLKTGEMRELRMGMSAAGGSIYAVPARHGEWTEGYSHVLASEVRSVEIQVRPYTFVQFDRISLQHR
jgi:hypothetical protein